MNRDHVNARVVEIRTESEPINTLSASALRIFLVTTADQAQVPRIAEATSCEHGGSGASHVASRVVLIVTCEHLSLQPSVAALYIKLHSLHAFTKPRIWQAISPSQVPLFQAV